MLEEFAAFSSFDLGTHERVSCTLTTCCHRRSNWRGGAAEYSYRTLTRPQLWYFASAATANSLLRRCNNGDVPLFLRLQSVYSVNSPFAHAFCNQLQNPIMGVASHTYPIAAIGPVIDRQLSVHLACKAELQQSAAFLLFVRFGDSINGALRLASNCRSGADELVLDMSR